MMSEVAGAGPRPRRGRVCWDYAWQAFHPKHHGFEQRVVEFEAIRDDAPHHLNRVVVQYGAGHELLLARLLHPSRAARTGTAKWLTRTRAFRETVGAA